MLNDFELWDLMLALSPGLSQPRGSVYFDPGCHYSSVDIFPGSTVNFNWEQSPLVRRFYITCALELTVRAW